MLDIKYNYLTGSSEPFPDNYDIDKRIDPDTDGCKKLYDDIIEAFFSNERINRDNKIDTVENWEQQYGDSPAFYTIRINKDKEDQILLSSDYIGPSVYWAYDSGIDDAQIKSFLEISRTIGGHIVWPRGRELAKKINTSRAGNNGVYDRIDWTLVLLKIYYDDYNKVSFMDKANNLIPETFRNKSDFNDKFFEMFSAFESSKSWFEKFGTFKNFCVQFKFLGNFVDYNFNIVMMDNLFPILPSDYKHYINNICQAIKLRNALLIYPWRNKIEFKEEIKEWLREIKLLLE